MRLVLFRSFLHARGCPAARLSQLAAAASSFDGVELSLRQLTPSVFDACEHASLRISCRLSLRADEEADRQLDQLSSVLATHRAAESLLETVIVSSDAAGAGPEATAEGLAELVRYCADTYVPEPPWCAYGPRVPPSWVLYVPAAQGSSPRGPRITIVRTSLRARRVYTAYSAYCVAPQVAHLSAACSSGAQFLTEHPLVGSAHGKRNAHGAPLGYLVSS